MRNILKSVLTGSLMLVAGAALGQQTQQVQPVPRAPQAPQVQQRLPQPQLPPLTQQQLPAPQAGIQPEEANPIGIWVTEGGKSRVQVSDCGGALCANIIWLRDPNDKRGRPWTDQLNNNVSLRGRPIIGLELFRNMRPVSRLAWKGRIYNPEDGDSYDVTLTLVRPDRISIKGCVLFVCETHHWVKYTQAN
jgi:uncharacterized protein (DUF2147 family)